MCKEFFHAYNEWSKIHPQFVVELQDSAIWRIPWGYHRQMFRRARENNVLCTKDTRKWLELERPFKLYRYRPFANGKGRQLPTSRCHILLGKMTLRRK